MFYNQGKYGKLKHIKIMGGLPMDKEEVVSKNFIEKIIDRPVKIKEYYYKNKLYKRTLNQQDDKGVWKKIGSSKRFSIIFKRKNIKIIN